MGRKKYKKNTYGKKGDVQISVKRPFLLGRENGRKGEKGGGNKDRGTKNQTKSESSQCGICGLKQKKDKKDPDRYDLCEDTKSLIDDVCRIFKEYKDSNSSNQQEYKNEY
ncbi:hypothetical protein BPIT_09730 [Candidatus Brocadia pituitae]|nr:hypothetical protein BPIT_09730 [Candidatus Brocadia pituitae]